MTLGSYANFLKNQRKDYDRAEEFYQKAIAADSNRTAGLLNYAKFLQFQRKDYQRAEEYYQKALTADPNDAFTLYTYANFLVNLRKDYQRAEEYYLKAIAAEPDNTISLASYANFLQTLRKDYEGAEEYYQKALTADPNDAFALVYYAGFLKNRRKDYGRAEEYYQKALAANPDHASSLGNYTQLLVGCERFGEAAPLAKRAWTLLPDWNEMMLCKLAFSRWLLSALAGTDGQSALGRLKTLLQAGYVRYPWNFDAMLVACLPKLNEEQAQLAPKLAAAILDESKLAELDTDSNWRIIQAISLNTPWPDEPGPNHD